MLNIIDEYHPDYPLIYNSLPCAEDHGSQSILKKRRISRKSQRQFRKYLLSEHPYCHYCSRKVNKHSSSIDHKHPLSKGGGNKRKNLVLSCTECNNKKGDSTYAEFIAIMKIEENFASD